MGVSFFWVLLSSVRFREQARDTEMSARKRSSGSMDGASTCDPLRQGWGRPRHADGSLYLRCLLFTLSQYLKTCRQRRCSQIQYHISQQGQVTTATGLESEQGTASNSLEARSCSDEYMQKSQGFKCRFEAGALPWRYCTED